MNHQTAGRILAELDRLPRSDAQLVALRDDLYLLAVRYAQIRAEWTFLTPDERRTADPRRTAAHNALIDACNILSRAMANVGLEIGWREELGNDRREIGDFACHLHCRLGLKAR